LIPSLSSIFIPFSIEEFLRAKRAKNSTASADRKIPLMQKMVATRKWGKAQRLADGLEKEQKMQEMVNPLPSPKLTFFWLQKTAHFSVADYLPKQRLIHFFANFTPLFPVDCKQETQPRPAALGNLTPRAGAAHQLP